MGLTDIEDAVDYREAFAEFAGKERKVAVRAYRIREGLTQDQLAALTGIPRRHISDMENGRRPIGKEPSVFELANASWCHDEAVPVLPDSATDIPQNFKPNFCMRSCILAFRLGRSLQTTSQTRARLTPR